MEDPRTELEYLRRLIDKINNVIDRETADLKYHEGIGDEQAAETDRTILAILKKRLEHHESLAAELELKL